MLLSLVKLHQLLIIYLSFYFRLLFLDQQIHELESMKPPNFSSSHSFPPSSGGGGGGGGQ